MGCWMIYLLGVQRGRFRILSSEMSRGWDVRAGCWMIYLPGVENGRFRMLSSEMSRGWDVRAASWMIYLPVFREVGLEC